MIVQRREPSVVQGLYRNLNGKSPAGVAELADAWDLKSHGQ